MRQVLVVDDSPVIRKVARRIFEGLGFGTVEAEDGTRALDMCREEMPDVVLLDWNLPAMDGFAVLRQLRAMPRGDEPTIVWCTTEHDVAHIARARHAGADAYLLKPFDRTMVEAKMAELEAA